MKKNIVVKIIVEGLHCWKNCPINEVDYLKTKHRHLFHIIIEKEVSHLDRDIEIIQFKHEVSEYLHKKFFDKKRKLLDFKEMSCEQICLDLIKKFLLHSCEVLEDNENGAKIYD